MAKLKLFALAALYLMLTDVAVAQETPAGFPDWLAAMEQEAISAGVSPQTAHAALDSAMLDPRVVNLDQKQPETTITFAAYSERNLSATTIDAGRDALAENKSTLNDVAERYGVPPQIILALWGMESRFGHNSGSYNVVDSLTTLAYEGRRAAFFRKELVFALKIIDREYLPPAALRGSWAGAMGQCQFMPSTYFNYGVDYNRDGLIDIWQNTGDVFASIANYLAAEGWHPGIGWGQEVIVDPAIALPTIGLDHPLTGSQWSQYGLRNLDGSSPANNDLSLALIQPDGPTGRSFLVTDNYRAIMRWNRSTFFATTVGLLADQISR